MKTNALVSRVFGAGLLPAIVAACAASGSASIQTHDSWADEGGSIDGDAHPTVTESCNGMDDDGDGLVDEGATGYGLLAETCSTSCGSGSRTCMAGLWGTCSAPAPTWTGACPCTEGTARDCSNSCGPGLETCTGGVFSGCTAPAPGEEECGDGVDGDCDGMVDEDCGDCTPGERKRCGSDTGECTAGTRTCRADGSWGSCVGSVGAGEEICDGLDNDCDGDSDEGMSPDLGEYNDSCAMARRLPDVEEGASGIGLSASVYPDGDEDWLWFRAVEGWHDCDPFAGQCYYDLTARLEAPEGADFELCLYPAWPGDSPDCSMASDPSMAYCTEPGEDDMTLEWEGICMVDDSLDFIAVVKARAGADPTCEPYELHLSLEGPSDICPGEGY